MVFFISAFAALFYAFYTYLARSTRLTFLTHLELHYSVGMEIGGGYDCITAGYLSPSKFIKGHRK